MNTTEDKTEATRTESDSLGSRQVPADAYYGIQALRASENFPISGFRPKDLYPELPVCLGWIKKAAAQTNMAAGVLDPDDGERNQKIGNAILRACDEMIAGDFDDQFIVDPWQGGTGTSHHMNANEILANRATELLGGERGQFNTPNAVHPNDHVNYGQSTNDVMPTAIRLMVLGGHPHLENAVNHLIRVWEDRATTFKHVVIPGRTHMQDAVPMTAGQLFNGYATQLVHCLASLEAAIGPLYGMSLGGTAVGTGLNTAPGYRKTVVETLCKITEWPLYAVDDYFAATSSFLEFSGYSAAMRQLALALEKQAQDLKLYSSGPMTMVGDLKLPQLQPGSSIMPGKVNPVMPELMNQISYAVQGNDLSISLAVQNGQLQLNVMMPLLLIKLSESQKLLTNSLRVFADTCVAGLAVNEAGVKHKLDRSAVLVTALNPTIGYEAAAKVAKLVMSENKTVHQAVLELGITDHHGCVLDEARLNELLSPDSMVTVD
ncbi:MAG: aspartate ammonia-lyase [Vampirovibrionales bacterium]